MKARTVILTMEQTSPKPEHNEVCTPMSAESQFQREENIWPYDICTWIIINVRLALPRLSKDVISRTAEPLLGMARWPNSTGGRKRRVRSRWAD